jgi:glutaredoxin
MVKRYLDNKKIPFIEINIENDEDVINFLKGQGISSAPAIFYGETDKNNGLLLENATNFTGNNQNELKKLVEFFE